MMVSVEVEDMVVYASRGRARMGKRVLRLGEWVSRGRNRLIHRVRDKVERDVAPDL